jgi:hypothetical protein
MLQVMVALFPEHDDRHRWRVQLSLNQREASGTDYPQLTMACQETPPRPW